MNRTSNRLSTDSPTKREGGFTFKKVSVLIEAQAFGCAAAGRPALQRVLAEDFVENVRRRRPAETDRCTK